MKTRSISLISIIIIVSLALDSCKDNSAKNDNSTLQQEPKASPHTSDSPKLESKKEDPNVEIAKEAIDAVAVLADKAISNQRLKDSIRTANRESMFVYQIGLPIIHEKDIFDVVHKLVGIENVSVFKNSRKEHYIIVNEQKTKMELVDGLAALNSQLADLNTRAKIINLYNFCNKKEIPMSDGKITKRKDDLELECITCQK